MDRDLPLYARIAERILQDIKDGELAVGERLPSDEEIAGAHAASVATVRRALKTLTNRGVIERRQGVGTFARGLGRHGPQERLTRSTAPFRAEVTSLVEFLLRDQEGFERADVVSLDIVPAPAHVRHALTLPEGAPVIEVVRVLRAARRTLSYLPQDLGAQFDRAAFARTSVPALLIQSGLSFAYARQKIACEPADGIIAEQMAVPSGTPLASFELSVFDMHGRGIYWGRGWYHWESFEYIADLYR